MKKMERVLRIVALGIVALGVAYAVSLCAPQPKPITPTPSVEQAYFTPAFTQTAIPKPTQTAIPTNTPTFISIPIPTYTPISKYTNTPAPSMTPTIEDIVDNEVKICSFNIQIFGQDKVSKPEVVDVLAHIVRECDITAVQEIRDSSGTVLPIFMESVNSLPGSEYSYIIDERLGRSSSKEQYAFIYNTDTVIFGNDSYTFNDTEDIFEREPFIAEFSSGGFDYALVNIHTKPDDAKKEICSLADVVNNAQEHFQNDDDVIVLGDFNADGSYFSEENETCAFRFDPYAWAINDNADTTLAASENTYDRIVFDDRYTEEDFSAREGVIRFDEIFGLSPDSAKEVSDHYPIWAEFYTNMDSD